METSQILLIIFSLCTTAAVIVLAIIFAQASNDRDDEAHQKNVCEGNLRQARSDLKLARDDIDDLQKNTLNVNCGEAVINNTCQAGMVLVAKTLGDELGLKVTLLQQGTSVGTSTASYGSTPNVFVVATTSNPKGSKSKNVTNIQAVSGITALKKITKYLENEPIVSFKIENPDGTTNVHQGSDPYIMEFVNAFNERVPKVLTQQTIEGYTEPLDSKVTSGLRYVGDQCVQDLNPDSATYRLGNCGQTSKWGANEENPVICGGLYNGDGTNCNDGIPCGCYQDTEMIKYADGYPVYPRCIQTGYTARSPFGPPTARANFPAAFSGPSSACWTTKNPSGFCNSCCPPDWGTGTSASGNFLNCVPPSSQPPTPKPPKPPGPTSACIWRYGSKTGHQQPFITDSPSGIGFGCGPDDSPDKCACTRYAVVGDKKGDINAWWNFGGAPWDFHIDGSFDPHYINYFKKMLTPSSAPSGKGPGYDATECLESFKSTKKWGDDDASVKSSLNKFNVLCMADKIDPDWRDPPSAWNINKLPTCGPKPYQEGVAGSGPYTYSDTGMNDPVMGPLAAKCADTWWDRSPSSAHWGWCGKQGAGVNQLVLACENVGMGSAVSNIGDWGGPFDKSKKDIRPAEKALQNCVNSCPTGLCSRCDIPYEASPIKFTCGVCDDSPKPHPPTPKPPTPKPPTPKPPTPKPVDCKLSKWSAWSTCSEPCGGGTQMRTRKVVQNPEHGGKACDPLTQSQACNKQPCPTPKPHHIIGGPSGVYHGPGAQCSKNSHCGPDLVCHNNTCKAKAPPHPPKPHHIIGGPSGVYHGAGAHCSNNSNCQDDLVCKNGICQHDTGFNPQQPKPPHMIGGPSGVYHGPYDIPFDTVGRDVMRVKTKESYSCGSKLKNRWRRK